jgi:hypothetical protein
MCCKRGRSPIVSITAIAFDSSSFDDRPFDVIIVQQVNFSKAQQLLIFAKEG